MTIQERAVMKQALEALEAMKAEFRALDLPYGSKAYTQGNEASNVLLAALAAFLDTHRWNIERDDEALLICEGQHEKHEPCEYQRYVLAEPVKETVKETETVDQRVVPLVESALQAVAEKIGDQCAVWYGIGARDVEAVLREAARYGLVHGALAEPEPVQKSNVYSYAARLATSIHVKHFKDAAPQWRPLPDLLGVLTQIDNMVSGLPRPPEPAQEALASMYIALCDAMGYSECKGDRMYSPEEWAAHLYAKTLRTPTDDASLFGKLGRVMWEMTTTVHSPGISFSEQLELIPTIWSELAKSHRAQRPLLTDEEIEMMWSLTPQDDRREGIYFARRIEKMIRGEKE